jgi:hypothetical protein
MGGWCGNMNTPWTNPQFRGGVRIVPEPKLQADPTFVSMVRSVLVFYTALGLFIYAVVEFCVHV